MITIEVSNRHIFRVERVALCATPTGGDVLELEGPTDMVTVTHDVQATFEAIRAAIRLGAIVYSLDEKAYIPHPLQSMLEVEGPEILPQGLLDLDVAPD